ncbi:2,3-bisphosphoglycerate-independent phosphoglycerate mutase [Algisphaera agarilytica]|uniref:2,3-bisphosphoglycerate-independent phosphoglycerate mutase n=1 Tax=Algisphaera agarilytica TaxID=1385975 RepID=A0A7X0H4S4_9BACT|nr:2,3-bisphosphoglycerate-independent phosphoglycerate mutase [Algisphaera agarilytica]MBB6429088.1 2,3-bisphosphoglycerate-independent phosphoglycerate mutase [Algisphaera agarilytica]
MSAKPVVLIVRDGWGTNPNAEHDDFNAIKLAETPRCDALLARYPHTLIHTSGRDVGLPEGTMGNSEVGHQNIGAGRIVYQESVRITVSIEDESFYDNAAITAAINAAKESGGKVHLLGIASDAGVHGRLEHLYACVEACKRAGLGPRDVCLHLFTDGRDTGPFTGKDFLEEIEEKIEDIGCGRIVSLCGRYYAMDRDNRWERVQLAYDLLTGRAKEDANPDFPTAAEALADYYDEPTNDSQNGDEFVTPRTIGGAEKNRIADGDTVLFYNYRGDRPREITRAFMQPDFRGNVPPSPDSGEQGFDRGEQLKLNYVCMTAYDETFTAFPNLSVAFEKSGKMPEILGQYLSEQGKTQLRVAETEKFPHVTFFANDYREDAFPGETREMAQSPQVATYDLQPQMSAPEIRDIVLKHVNSDDCPDFILVNFANGDMVGHTGKLNAAIAAVETVDTCTGEIVEAVLAKGGKLIVTADHGNAEQMYDPDTKAPHTAHTTYDVECIIVDPSLKVDTPLRPGGRLADCAPTALQLMGLDKPEEMDGVSLLSV